MNMNTIKEEGIKTKMNNCLCLENFCPCFLFRVVLDEGKDDQRAKLVEKRVNKSGIQFD